MDGLAAGTSAIIGITLAIFAWVSGNTIFADYLNIMFIPNSGELVIFCTAFVGACVGFLVVQLVPGPGFYGRYRQFVHWRYYCGSGPDFAQRILIPVLCGIFLIENLSVMLQVSYFKYTKKKYGEGRRIFKMCAVAPPLPED